MKNPVKQRAGKMGGRRTVERHGVEHMRRIGRRGAQVFWQRNRLHPTGEGDFYIVRRATGEIIGRTPPHYGRQ